MKPATLTTSAFVLLFGAASAIAQTTADEHAAHHPEGAPPPPVSSAVQGMVPPAMTRLQGNMKSMQELMAKIHASKDGAERKRLLQQHSEAMEEQMEMMRGMGGSAGGMKIGGMQGEASPTASAQGGPAMVDAMMKQMMMNHQAMQGRMDAIEMMMGQMLQHQEAQQEAKPAK